MASLREQKKARARDRIIATAADLFDRRGYESVTMRDIASIAGVSYQTVYNYFPGKARILFEILLRESRNAEQRLRLTLDPDHDEWPGLPTAIDRLVTAAFDMLEQHEPSYWRTVTAEMVREPETFGPLVGLMDAEWREAIVSLLIAARERGELAASVDLTVLSQVLIYLIDHGGLRVITLPGAEPDCVASEVRGELRLVLTPYLNQAATQDRSPRRRMRGKD